MYTVTVVAQKYTNTGLKMRILIDNAMGSINTCGLYTLFWYAKKKKNKTKKPLKIICM